MMRKTITLLIALFSITAFAQVDISFEADEGYELGSIHGQKGWEVTEHDLDGFITHQVISDDYASEGNFSFKNGFESDYDWQYFPIFGATNLFDEPVDYTDFSISYDVMVTDTLGSDFEFVLFTINEYDEWSPVAGVGIENRGYIYLVKDENYDFDYAETEWEAGEWTHIKIEVDEQEIRYFVNEVLENTISNFSENNILGFNMLHNNYGHDAYYDNFVISSGSMHTPKFTKDEIVVYPNPVEDFMHLQIADNIEVESLQLFNLLGQEVLNDAFKERLNVAHLEAGLYVLKVNGVNGEVYTQKMMKK